jgi:hypothetical protein
MVEVSMRQTRRLRTAIKAVAVVTGLVAWPAAATAQTPVGSAEAARVTTGATTTSLASTGALSGVNDAREASMLTGSVPAVLGAEVLRAATIGWADQVSSGSSLANLGLSLAGIGISADFVGAEATALLGALGRGVSFIDNLSINGVPVPVTGEPNQVVSIPGGQVVINEQVVSLGQTTVNALHATVFGVSDVVVGSATAGIR